MYNVYIKIGEVFLFLSVPLHRVGYSAGCVKLVEFTDTFCLRSKTIVSGDHFDDLSASIF